MSTDGGRICFHFGLPLLKSHKDGTDQKQGTEQMSLCDHRDWALSGIQEPRYSVSARNLCLLAWRLGGGLEEPRDSDTDVVYG